MSSKQNNRSEQEIYLNPLTYLQDEFEKVRLLLRLAVHNFRKSTPVQTDSFKGLFISDAEIDQILAITPRADNTDDDIRELQQSIELLQAGIDQKLQRTEAEGKLLPISRLRDCFGLSDYEINVLLICLIPLYQVDFEKLFGFLQNDASSIYPTINLIERVLTATFEERCRVRDCFSSHGPLLKWQLICPCDKSATELLNPTTPFLIDPRIAAYLTGSSLLDSKTDSCLSVIACDLTIEELPLPGALKSQIKNLTEYLSSPAANEIHHIFALSGLTGSGKRQAAAVMAKTVGLPLLSLRLAPVTGSLEVFKNSVKRVLREVILVGSGLLIEDYDLLSEETLVSSAQRDFLLEQLQVCCWLCFVLSCKEIARPVQMAGNRFIKLLFPVPEFALRVAIWQKAFLDRELMGFDASSAQLANRFKFNRTQIVNAVDSAMDNALSRTQTNKAITEQDLLQGCWEQCNRGLTKLAIKIESHSGWDDLVLPEEQMTLLREVCNQFCNRSVVFSQWGFQEKIAYGRGLSVLFSGPSGTGKTMAAGTIARELKLELYKIDLSTVVSKYIGETEKNLARIFEEAETSNAILFFDEADALFGKRSEISNAHDRYANIETSYLLQKMEEYEGITILASNFRQNMDQAFMRRLQFIVEFPFPDQKLRERIWRGVFPGRAPVADTIDYTFLSSHLKLAGGNIKNVAVNASFYAAEERSNIQIRHIMLAARREYTKLGMSFIKSDMAPYFELTEKRD